MSARRSLRAAAAAVSLALVAVLAACSSPAPAASSPAEQKTLTVFAAASLRDVFTQIGDSFSADNPGVTVQFNFAGSSDLVSQLAAGARADVLATADTITMQKAVTAGDITATPVVFATNTLTIVTPPGNPGSINSFKDLAKPGAKIVVCAQQVPCGAATYKVASALGVTLAPVSQESSVTDVLGKVTSGQADAGVVYKTDAALAASKVTEVPFSEASVAVNQYPIALVGGGVQSDLAQKFIDYVTGESGRDQLSLAGFGAP